MVRRQRLLKTYDRREVYVPYSHNERWWKCEIWRQPSWQNHWYMNYWLKHNLLIIIQFYDNGYDVMFDKTNCTIVNKNDNSITLKGKRIDNVYKTNFSELVDQKVVCLLSVNDKKWVWHRRLGHANWRLISKLSKLQLVRGLPKIDYHSDALCGAWQK